MWTSRDPIFRFISLRLCMWTDFFLFSPVHKNLVKLWPIDILRFLQISSKGGFLIRQWLDQGSYQFHRRVTHASGCNCWLSMKVNSEDAHGHADCDAQSRSAADNEHLCFQHILVAQTVCFCIWVFNSCRMRNQYAHTHSHTRVRVKDSIKAILTCSCFMSCYEGRGVCKFHVYHLEALPDQNFEVSMPARIKFTRCPFRRRSFLFSNVMANYLFRFCSRFEWGPRGAERCSSCRGRSSSKRLWMSTVHLAARNISLQTLTLNYVWFVLD